MSEQSDFTGKNSSYELDSSQLSREDLVRMFSVQKSIIESAADAILVVDLSGKVVTYNAKFAILFGIPESILSKMNDDPFVKASLPLIKDSNKLLQGMEKVYSKPQEDSYDLFDLIDDRMVERRSTPQYFEGKIIGRVWVFREVTEVLGSRKALRESEVFYRSIFYAINEAIFIYDLATGAILDANNKLLEMFRFNYNTTKQISIEKLSEGNPPYSNEEFLSRIQKASQGVPQIFLWLLKRADDTRFWSEVTLHSVGISGKQRILGVVRDISKRLKAEEALRLSEEKFSIVFKLSPDLIVLTRIPDGKIVDCNYTFASEIGIPYEQILNKTTEQLGIWASNEQRLDYLREIQEKGEVLDKEIIAKKPDNKLWDLLFSSRIITIDDQSFILSIGRNVTSLKETERALKQTNRALRLLYQCNSAVVNATEEVQLLNDICRIAVEFAGYKMAWVGIAEHDKVKTVKPVTSCGPGEFLKKIFVSWGENENGSGAAGTAIRTGKPSVARDIKNNPNYSQWRETLVYQGFASAMAIPLCTGQEILGVVIIYAAEVDAFDTTEIGLLEELGKNISHGITAIRASKERIEALSALKKARNELEKRVAERTRDLTESNKILFVEIEHRRRIELSLRESEKRIRAVFEQAAVGVAILESKSCRFLELNNRYCEIVGFSEEELLQKTCMDITYPDDITPDVKQMELLINGKIRRFFLEKRLIRKDGLIVWVNLTVSAMWGIGEEPSTHIAVIEDITDRKSAEETLRRSKEKYRELVENANSIILRMDITGKITFFNEFAQKFFGFTEKEIVGRSVIGTIVPEKETSGRDLQKMISEIGLYPDKFTRNENENVRKNGEKVWISWTNKPYFDSLGNHIETLCIGNDITDLKKTEIELFKAKEAAESADHLKSAFLAAMSHELRTPLNSIIGFTGILLQEIPGSLNAEQKKQLGMVSNSAQHLLSLINDVLDLSKIEAGQLQLQYELFEAQEAILKTVELVEPMVQKKSLLLRINIDFQSMYIIGDQRRFEQVLMNLLSNAIKFTDYGEICVSTQVKTGSLYVSVKDTGIGIREEQKAELFHPFHQLDSGLTRRHEGTGLGLSICKRLVEMMGGSISFESEFGKGSTFTFSIPVSQGE